MLFVHLQLQKYLRLDQKGSIMVEYIWIDSEGGVRSKSRVSLQILPEHVFFLSVLGPPLGSGIFGET